MGSGYRSDGISHERLAAIAMDASQEQLNKEGEIRTLKRQIEKATSKGDLSYMKKLREELADAERELKSLGVNDAEFKIEKYGAQYQVLNSRGHKVAGPFSSHQQAANWVEKNEG